LIMIIIFCQGGPGRGGTVAGWASSSRRSDGLRKQVKQLYSARKSACWAAAAPSYTRAGATCTNYMPARLHFLMHRFASTDVKLGGFPLCANTSGQLRHTSPLFVSPIWRKWLLSHLTAWPGADGESDSEGAPSTPLQAYCGPKRVVHCHSRRGPARPIPTRRAPEGHGTQRPSGGSAHDGRSGRPVLDPLGRPGRDRPGTRTEETLREKPRQIGLFPVFCCLAKPLRGRASQLVSASTGRTGRPN
jgi:hypothetical protein